MIGTLEIVEIVLGAGAIGILVGGTISIYNTLVMLRHNIDKAWSNIDVLLKQRHDELTKLIDTAKEYMKYEKSLLEELTNMRTEFLRAIETSDVKKINELESRLHESLTKLFAVAENYPELKANESFLQLQKRISEIEEAIADRREFYNEAVNVYNIKLHQFPSNIVAALFGFKERELYKVHEEEKRDMKIAF